MRDTIWTEWRTLLVVVAIYLGLAGSSGLLAYINAALVGQRGFSPGSVFALLAGISVGTALFLPLWGHLADRLGRRPILIGGLIGGIVLSFPLMWVVSFGDLLTVTVVYFLFFIVNSVATAPGYTICAELFQRRVRYTGATLGTNLATIVASGLTPVVATQLALATGSGLAPAWWLIALSVTSLVGAWIAREPVHERA